MQIKIRLIFIILVFFSFLSACSIKPERPAFEIVKQCRNNINLLNEAIRKYIKDTPNPDLPLHDVVPLKPLETMVLTKAYLPEKPVPPTLDCNYRLVYKGPDNFSWFCDLHGLPSGDMRLTFPYHEYEFTAYFNKSYMTISKYQKHYEEIMRWTGYNRTLMESIKYHYSRNPTTTLIMVTFGVLFVLYVFKQLFW